MSQLPRPSTRPPASSYDAVVVGAHPAGAATAMLLARSGWRTLLLHRNGLSDDRFVTSPMQRGAALLLARWGLLDAVLAAGTAPVRRTIIRYGDAEEVISVQPSHGVDLLCAPSRSVLEPLLVGHAIDAGVDVRLGTAVTDLVWRGGRVAGVRIAAAPGQSFSVGARLVVGADGARSGVAERVGATPSWVGANASALTCAQWSGLGGDAYEWTFRADACVAVIPVAADRSCVMGCASPRRIGPGGPMVLREIVEAGSPQLAARLDSAAMRPGWRTWPGRPGHLRPCAGPGWALVGAAATAEDPIGAHGPTAALRDAELLVRAVGSPDGSDTALDAALREHRAQRDRRSRPLLETLDRLAGHRWDETEVTDLLRRLRSAMADEADDLASAVPLRPLADTASPDEPVRSR
jgi:2-polyprenyl-6-methoxyphenol hydroxylase-like FAD-dependent oxidoreductase